VPLLVVLHVLSAVIGIGPTFFFPVLLRPALPPSELRGVLAVSARLARYPQIGGPLTLLSGIALVCAVDTRLFKQTWIFGSLALFVVIQAIILAVAVPATKKVAAWAFAPANADAKVVSPEVEATYGRARGAHVVAGLLGVVLFALMILKPG
jgi:uncharacterized membrane protein